MLKKNIIVICLILITKLSSSQELQAKVSINASRINTTVDKKIFVTLQNQLTDFLNSRKWTNQVFKQNERINCSFVLNLDNGTDQNTFKATLIVQAARPVYNASYQSAIVNFQDPDILFKYIEYQPIEFDDNRVQGIDALKSNLSACLAYYAYLIVALDFDSFSPKAGETYYKKAQNIVNNAPEGSGINGWRSFDGLFNRYWLIENLVNARNNIIHDVIYSYYRAGLDKMYENEKEAQNNILQSLIQLQAFNKEIPNTMIVQFLTQTKTQEFIGIFKNADSDVKTRALEVLSKLDAASAATYRDQLK
ncbi:MAG: DUF4835 family protein [Bacteroidetes bacterium]|nr:DUF4835 family protein [Bacteroidota bacterium]MBS1638749.1 DUF4835 family protein [Bacteroidota bacterium]MBS1642170.1 DUF4835 family protein [Bacteroidota bacterium]MBS1670931.1 DUF4835 family protein [Bacteroidota bacterium]